MKMLIRGAVLLAATLTLSAQDSPVAKARSWRALHEPQILRELFDLVAIPNVASDKEGIARNAQALMRMFEKRRFLPETIATAGSPVVLAERRAPGLARTLTFYFHYDGQPVEEREWNERSAVLAGHRDRRRFVVAADAGSAVRRDRSEWRVYGRSSSDDKAPIVAFLSAIEALDAANVR
jgi:acetylornithine deacetylase/succinyl-diaminopimelate desuccinylase-like protein